MLTTSAALNGWALCSLSVQKTADCAGMAVLWVVFKASRSKQSSFMLLQSIWMVLPSACASPFGPSMTYFGPVTPRDERKTPCIDARAAWEEFKPFHCELYPESCRACGAHGQQRNDITANFDSRCGSCLVQLQRFGRSGCYRE